MFEKTIEDIIERDPIIKKICLGCLSRDEIPLKIKNFPACFIMNTKPRSNKGEHWLALYYNKEGEAFFFDSYGYPPSFYRLESYVKSTSANKKYKFNSTRIQGDSALCGLYCILFLYYMTRNRLPEFYSKFNDTNYNANDKYLINQLLDYYYSK